MPAKEEGILQNAIVGGTALKGLSVKTADGRPAQFAILDEEGNIVEKGPGVARAAWLITVRCYKLFMAGKGYLKIWTGPPSQFPDAGHSGIRKTFDDL